MSKRSLFIRVVLVALIYVVFAAPLPLQEVLVKPLRPAVDGYLSLGPFLDTRIEPFPHAGYPIDSAIKVKGRYPIPQNPAPVLTVPVSLQALVVSPFVLFFSLFLLSKLRRKRLLIVLGLGTLLILGFVGFRLYIPVVENIAGVPIDLFVDPGKLGSEIFSLLINHPRLLAVLSYATYESPFAPIIFPGVVWIGLVAASSPKLFSNSQARA
ncbi:MAG: hypothetical protein HKN21_02300 [Candidatus Eisenbacteria bacterium]|uniref:Uncharacterized protein n=1 Tax=Eiseniibacteriota bacterium TaxID=2212470 RepID=A0A7Y2H120_UNCEI|nr:hypothetical protein [Candidatus Eisenbacteria bacterium]